jgi:hypothetical protein
MFAVVFPVAVVIDDIDTAGDGRKGDKTQRHMEQFSEVEDLTAEKQGQEEE